MYDMQKLMDIYKGQGFRYLSSWHCLNMYKNTPIPGQAFCNGVDLALIAQKNTAMRRQTYVSEPQGPFAMHNTLLVTEAPRPPKDLTGSSVNRAFKSWQGPCDFLLQFGTHTGWIYSMMDGLGAVAQAVAYIGGYNAVCVEKDPVIYKAACENVSKWIADLDAKVISIFSLTFCFL